MTNKSHQKDLEQELESLSPFLKKIKDKESGMQVPENYFHNLQVDFFNSLAIENEVVKDEMPPQDSWLEQTTGIIRQLFRPKVVFALASFTLVCLTTWLILSQPPASMETIALDDISTEDLEWFLEENLEEFSTEMLVEENEHILENSLEEKGAYEEYLDEVLDDTDLNDLL